MLDLFRKITNKKGDFGGITELLSFIKNNPQFRADIETVYYQIRHRRLRGCSNCIADAFIELCTLKEEDIIQHMECRFKLRAGVLILNPNDGRKNISNYNITDAAAIEALAQDPSKIALFDDFPSSWEAEVADFLKPDEVKEEPKATTTTTRKKTTRKSSKK